MCVLHEPMANTVHCTQCTGLEIISVLATGLTVLTAGTLEFMSSFCQYFPQDRYFVPLDCLSQRHGTPRKRSTGINEVPLGDFNFKIRHENVDNVN